MLGLNTCPHCGNETRFEEKDNGIIAICSVCRCQTDVVPLSVDYAAKEEAATVWNGTKSYPKWAEVSQ